MAIDTRKHRLAVQVTPAKGQERTQVRSLTQDVPHATGEAIEIAFVDQGRTGQEPAHAANDDGIQLQVMKPQEAKEGFVLLPRSWVMERSLGGSIV